MLSFNPVSKLSWLYDTFVKRRNPRATVHHSTFINNAFLGDSDEYKAILARYKGTKNEHQYKVYYLGEWGALEGLIYTNWQEYDRAPTPDEVVYGCDFGFDDPTAIVKVSASKDGFYVEELLYNSDMTNDDLIDWLKRRDLAGEPKIYCDSANPDRIEALVRSGIRAIPSRKGQGSVQAGIDYIKGKDIYVKGKHLLNEIQDYTYKKDRHGRSMEKPEDGNDHLLDAMRYAIFTHFAKKMDFTFITSGD
jgi:phage terminase large subunit